MAVVTLKVGARAHTPIVIWTDLPNGSPFQGRGTNDWASYTGSHRSSDGRRVDFHGQITNGQTGPLTIAGLHYGLTKGSLFLVSTQQTPFEISQIPFDVSGFPTDKGALKELAASNPTIGGFFRKHSSARDP